MEALKGDLAEVYGGGIGGGLAEVYGGGIGGRSGKGIWWRHWGEVWQRYMVEALEGGLAEVYGGCVGGRSN